MPIENQKTIKDFSVKLAITLALLKDYNSFISKISPSILYLNIFEKTEEDTKLVYPVLSTMQTQWNVLSISKDESALLEYTNNNADELNKIRDEILSSIDHYLQVALNLRQDIMEMIGKFDSASKLDFPHTIYKPYPNSSSTDYNVFTMTLDWLKWYLDKGFDYFDIGSFYFDFNLLVHVYARLLNVLEVKDGAPRFVCSND